MRRVFVLFAASLLSVPMCLQAEEAEVEISVKQIPARVVKAAQAKVKGFEAEEAQIESILVYEIEGELDGQDIEIELTAEGEIFTVEIEEDKADDDEQAVTERDDEEGESNQEGAEDEDEVEEQEMELKPKALPKAILKAIHKKFPGIEIEQASVESILVFSIEGEVREQDFEIEVTADGDVIEVEQESE